MKIAHVFWGLSYGGIETMLVNIANEQAKLGVKVCIIIINDLVVDELLNYIVPEVRLVRLNRKIGSKSLDFIWKLNKVLEQIQPDVIHLHGSEMLNFLEKKWVSLSCRTVHAMPWGHFGSSSRWMSLLQWMAGLNKGNVMCLNRVPKVFSISKSVANVLDDKYGIESTVIPNGIAVSRFVSRKKLDDDPIFHIVQVSRLVHETKGQDLLIKAVAMLRKRGYENLDVTFIGDGESKEYLESLAIEKEVEHCVNFLGFQPQSYIACHLKDYDLFVQPSRCEGFGLTVAEAMAAKVPVLVSEGQGPAEITEGDRYGWVFKNGDVNDLADNLLYVIQQENEAYAKADKAYEMVAKKYNVAVTARKYIEQYKILTNRCI